MWGVKRGMAGRCNATYLDPCQKQRRRTCARHDIELVAMSTYSRRPANAGTKADRVAPAHERIDQSIGTIAAIQSCDPFTRERWPFPDVSSISRVSPGPKVRFSPSLVLISKCPSRHSRN